MKIRPSIILLKGGQVLLMRYLYGETEVWGVPGGGPLEGESLIATLERELDEELGVQIEVKGLAAVLETPTTETVRHTLHLVFVGEIVGGEVRPNPEHTTAQGAEWVPLEKIEELILYPPVNDIVKDAIGGLIIKGGVEQKGARYLGIRERRWF